MSATVILTPKPTSLPFEDRIVNLDVPCKIGRSFKESQPDPKNGFFDSKVLSKQHAMIVYEDEQFFLIDTGSSNGSFVNNIRISKTGEQSKLTRIFSGDVLRFGSDVLDKSRNETQKCVIAKVKLFFPDGKPEIARPAESRLFKPNDTLEDLSALTQALQESLIREKTMEEKISNVRIMISKNIGKTHTDLLRLFENVKQELMADEEEYPSKKFDEDLYEKLSNENLALMKKVQELENIVAEDEVKKAELRKNAKANGVEIMTLKKACQIQKKDLEEFAKKVEKLEEDLKQAKIDSEEKFGHKVSELEKERDDLVKHYENEMEKQEEIFMEERNKIKEQLHNVTSNEVNLLNRIKCLEAEEGYSHAEVQRILQKEHEMNEQRQHDQYQIERLEKELQASKSELEAQRDKVIIQRSEEDIARIEEQELKLKRLQGDLSHVKHELIEARARKSASDNELGTIKGQVDTLKNNISALSQEREDLTSKIQDLEEALKEKTKEAEHLESLVAKMEAAASQDEVLRTELEDFKHELSMTEKALKKKNEELLQKVQDCQEKEDSLQQKEIEISVLRGQVQMAQEELHDLKSNTEAMHVPKSSYDDVLSRLRESQGFIEELNAVNAKINGDLEEYKTLYEEAQSMSNATEGEVAEWKKCREELEKYRDMVESMEQRGRRMSKSASVSPSEVAMGQVGSMRLYEVVLGLVFLLVMIDWTFFQ